MSLLSKIEEVLHDIDGAAAREAEQVLVAAKAEEAKVATTVQQLVTEAKSQVAAAVAGAEPAVVSAVTTLAGQLEADVQAALAGLLL